MPFFALYKRELFSFISTPIAWVTGFVFTALPAFAFFIQGGFIAQGAASLRPFFAWIPLIFTFVIPALTMRSWAEEKDNGSLELLLSLPLQPWEFIFSKFLAVLTILGAYLLFTLPIPLMVLPLGTFDLGEIFTEYFGSILLAGASVSLGIFISLLTSNQIVALVLGVLSILIATFIGRLPVFFPALEPVGGFFRFLSFEQHFQSFHRGLLDSRDVSFFLLVAFVFQYLSILILTDRKWRA